MSKATYDIEFAVQSEIYMRVQADSAEEAQRIAKDRFQKTDEFTIKSSNMDREIIAVHYLAEVGELLLKEEPCDLQATNQDMVYKYKFDMGKDK